MKNNGELPKYYAETHPAIIDTENFAKVQEMLAKSNERFKTRSTPNEVYPFTGMVKCGICGKNYRCKQNHGSVNWYCATYLREGKTACPSKAIPENILIDLSAEVLDLTEFDEDVFKQRIASMYISQSNKVTFIFIDPGYLSLFNMSSKGVRKWAFYGVLRKASKYSVANDT